MGERNDEISNLLAGAAKLNDAAARIVRKDTFDLAAFQIEVAQWAAFNFPKEQCHHLVYGMQEELGELCHAMLKREQGIRGTQDEHLAAVKDAMGDLFIFAAQFCNKQGVSMAECIEHAWENVKNRDWIAYPHNGRTE